MSMGVSLRRAETVGGSRGGADVDSVADGIGSYTSCC